MKKLILILIIVAIFLTTQGCISTSREVKVDSDMSQLQVYINGKIAGITPFIVQLTPGNYEFSEKRPFLGLTQNVEITGDTDSVFINSDEQYTSVISNKNEFTLNMNMQTEYDKDGFAIYLDGKFTGKVTPSYIENVQKGKHLIKLVSINGTYQKNFDVNGDTTFLSLRAFDKLPEELPVLVNDFKDKNKNSYELNFDYLPVEACCSYAQVAYSGIFVGDEIAISGETTYSDFYFLYPSGKKVRFTAEGTGDYKSFAKVVKFDEAGNYKILDDKGNLFDQFDVLYNVIPLPPAESVWEVFGTEGYNGSNNYDVVQKTNNALAIPSGEEIKLKLFVTDGHGNPVINNPIGEYGARTDSRGIVTLNVQGKSINGHGEVYVNGEARHAIIYADLLGWVYDRMVFNRTGQLLDTTFGVLYNKSGKIIKSMLEGLQTDVKYENGDVYIPSNIVSIVSNASSESKEFNGINYIAVNTIVDPEVAVIITDDVIELDRMCQMVY
jgi:hypothetical protein